MTRRLPEQSIGGYRSDDLEREPVDFSHPGGADLGDALDLPFPQDVDPDITAGADSNAGIDDICY